MGAARAKTTQDPMRLHISLNGAKISWHCGSRQQLEIAQVSILLGFVQLLNRIQRVFYSTDNGRSLDPCHRKQRFSKFPYFLSHY